MCAQQVQANLSIDFLFGFTFNSRNTILLHDITVCCLALFCRWPCTVIPSYLQDRWRHLQTHLQYRWWHIIIYLLDKWRYLPTYFYQHACRTGGATSSTWAARYLVRLQELLDGWFLQVAPRSTRSRLFSSQWLKSLLWTVSANTSVTSLGTTRAISSSRDVTGKWKDPFLFARLVLAVPKDDSEV